ncbi:MAG: hypothetical protein BGO39_17720 [Chloroflexi bacterium 54-19]|nr:MAG: hypothetical protein BGO39_17720 [Chloroflexi bacterium 54-19]
MRSWKIGLALVVVVALAVVAGGHLLQTSVASSPVISGCPVFPANNVWNTPISNLPVDPNSANFIASIGASTGLHPDFGSGTWDNFPIGIPYTTVPSNQTKVPVTFDYNDESDPGPYPIPPNAPVEGNPASGDRHVLVIQQGTCKLYETWASQKNSDNSWTAGSGAIFDLTSNALRPAGWTSADAAGLPIFPGLFRYDEVASGSINHALRFTIDNTRDSYIWPARHQASNSSNQNYPPMGQRFRLKANFDISGYPADVKVILTALKTYGMFVADNGSNWYLSGAPDPRWDNDELVTWLSKVKGSNFEAVDESSLMIDPNSAQAKGLAAAIAPVSGTPQGAVASAAFPNRLQALVTDIAGRPLSDQQVTFQAPTTGTTGAFAGNVSSYVTQTNASGIATSTAFTANGLTGSYIVTATVGDVTTPTTFQLKNLAGCAQPFVVTLSSDDGGSTVCGSLSRALLQGTTSTQISFDTTSMGGTELVVSGALPPVQAGVTLDGGSCDLLTGPSLSIRGNFSSGSSPGLVVMLGATVKNIRVSGFPGPQIQARAGGNSFKKCVWAAKSFP